MKKIILIITGLTILNAALSQDLTEPQVSSLKFRNKNLGVEKKKSIQKTRRGGNKTYPQGIANKKINVGFTLGGDLALMSALNVEKCPVGGNFSLFMHGVLKNTNTLAIGAEIKGFYLLSNKNNFADEYTVTGSDVNPPSVKVGNWIVATPQLSIMGNFNPLPRFNIQLKANAGPLVALVPVYEATYQFKERQFDGTFKTTNYYFKYAAPISKTMSIGAALTFGTDMLYALTKNIEFKAGVDWSYLRFNYNKLWTEKVDYTSYVAPPKIYETKEVAQFGVFDLHVGLAFSF